MVKGKNVLVTGGLGFLGSNLAVRLVNEGAKVTLVDDLIPDLGGNEFNIEEIKGKVEIIKGNLCDTKVTEKAVKSKDIIFHLAGQVDHHRSMAKPFEDLDIRCKATLTLLEAIRHHNPRAKLIFSSTRSVYGSPKTLPVPETAPTDPKGMYAATSLAAEKFIQIYGNAYGINYCILRITNVYGPKQQMRKSFGVANWFVRQVIDGSPIKVMGDGSNLRDFLYVDDLMDAFLALIDAEGVFNVASGKGVSFSELAEEVIRQNGEGKSEVVPMPDDVAVLEPGSFVSDISKISKVWKPKTKLADGLKATIAFYRKNRRRYW